MNSRPSVKSTGERKSRIELRFMPMCGSSWILLTRAHHWQMVAAMSGMKVNHSIEINSVQSPPFSPRF